MAKWWLKAAMQGLASQLPARQRLNYLAQRHLTRTLQPDRDELQRKLLICNKHIDYHHIISGANALPPVVLELGTGWFPIVPVGLFLCGAAQIYTVDIQNLLYPEYFRAMLRLLTSFSRDALANLLDYLDAARHEALQSIAAANLPVEATLAQLNITPIVADAANLTLDTDSVGLIVSNSTLEHIPLDDLQCIFPAFRRLLSPDGLMSHTIDSSDHYAHDDKRITPYNYLRFEDETWRWFNNALHYQNRLCSADYLQLHQAHGFEVLALERFDHHADLLKGVKLARRFQRYSRDELSPTRLWIVSR